jgi:hypothetical protein
MASAYGSIPLSKILKKGGADMDEATRMIAAYATVLLGLPILAAKVAWFVPGSISALVLAQVSDRLDKFIDALVKGFISLLFACLVFEHFDIRIEWAVPIILTIVTSFWNWVNDGPYKVFPAMAGILIGFILYPKVLPTIHLASTAFMQKVF